jgi:hypothetical protein
VAVLVIPLFVRPCAWQAAGWLAAIQGRPKNAKPLSEHRKSQADQVLVDLALEIRENLTPFPPLPSPTLPPTGRGGTQHSRDAYDSTNQPGPDPRPVKHGLHLQEREPLAANGFEVLSILSSTANCLELAANTCPRQSLDPLAAFTRQGWPLQAPRNAAK